MPSNSKNKYRRVTRKKGTNNPTEAISIDVNSESGDVSNEMASLKEPKPAPSPDEQKFVLTEVKWIGVVTGIVLILLIISYYLFR